MKVRDLGSDDMVRFDIDEIYSVELGELSMTKVYRPNNGNPPENLGHSVTLEFTWGVGNEQFEGR